MEAKKDRVEIISTKIIKPSSPTPLNNRIFKLSLFDQIFYKEIGPIIYFYNATTERALTTLSLQKSLSKTLDLFYPFAGQFNEDFTSIECNDHGAYFREAKIGSKLSDFLGNPDPKTVTDLLPCSDLNTTSEVTRDNVVTLVQLTVFSCGGIAIGIQVSHMIADGFSVSHFAKTWAAISAGQKEIPLPNFPGLAHHLPPVSSIKDIVPTDKKPPLKSRRFIINGSKLADLKKRIQQNGGVDFIPSTLEAVSSLFLKSIVAASGEGALFQMVNLRTRLTPSLPENCIGNYALPLIVSSPEIGSMTELDEIAQRVRKGMLDFFSDCSGERLKGDALVSAVLGFFKEAGELKKAGIFLNFFTFISSLRLYDTDFGSGEPVWVTSPLFFGKHIAMMHSKSGQDIEIWATFEKYVMEKLESNEELLKFASVDVLAMN